MMSAIVMQKIFALVVLLGLIALGDSTVRFVELLDPKCSA